MAICVDDVVIYDSAYDCFAHEIDMTHIFCDESYQGNIIEQEIDVRKHFPRKSPLSWENHSIVKGYSKNGTPVLMLEEATRDKIYLAFGWSDVNRKYTPVNGSYRALKALH